MPSMESRSTGWSTHDAMTVTVLVLGESDFEEAGVYHKGQTLSSPTLEGFSVNLDDIFRP